MDIREVVPPGLFHQLVYEKPDAIVKNKSNYDRNAWEEYEQWKVKPVTRPYVVAIVGSRKYFNIVHFRTILDPVLLSHLETGMTLVSGGAHGADELAEQYATEQNLPIVTYLPLWDVYGKYAGHMRNRYIIEACDECIAFWDMKSRGTENSIDWCKALDKPCRIVDIREFIKIDY